MKTIDVAIDFSKGAIIALEYAIGIANKAGASINIIWVDNMSDKDILLGVSKSLVEKEAAERLQCIVDTYKNKLTPGTLSYKLRSGRVYKEVGNQAKYDDADLIICGTHGTSEAENLWAGSNTYRIVSYTNIPVITIRHAFDPQATSGVVVMPVDSTAESRQKAEFTCNLAKILGLKIHVLGLYTTKLSAIQRKVDTSVKHVVKMIEEAGLEHVEHFKHSNNVTTTTIEYAEHVKADLISIMTEQEKTASNWLLGTYAEQMINASMIPVLCITPNDFILPNTIA